MPEYRQPPAATPRPFGLFSVESPTNKSDGPWATGAEWEPEACSVALNFANALCANPGTNEVQTSTITGTPTGGTFTLTLYGETTAPIAYNANATAVTNALNALSVVDPGDIVVTGGPAPGTAFTYTYGGRYAARNVPQITATGSFTGGTAPAIATATTTPGVQNAKTVGVYGAANTALPFTVYILNECRTVGEMSRAQARALNILTLNEEAAVEKELWTRMAAAATNITPGTAPSPEMGLALLEEAIGNNYAGRPIIHASPDVASILGTRGAHERHGNHLETKIGSAFAVERGAPDLGPGGAPAAGTEWIIASGGLFIERSTSPTLQGPFVVQQPLDNTQMVLAERTYVAGWDCTPVAIRVTLP